MLKESVQIIRKYQRDNNISNEDLRIIVVEEGLYGEGIREEVLLNVGNGEREYLSLLSDMMPKVGNYIKQGTLKLKDGEGCSRELVNALSIVAKGLTGDTQGGNSIDLNAIPLEDISVDYDENGQPIYTGLDTFKKQKELDIIGSAKVTLGVDDKEKSELLAKYRDGKYNYLKLLYKEGFIEIDDETEVGSNKELLSKTKNMLRSIYITESDTYSGMKDINLQPVSSLLASKGVDLSKVGLWDDSLQNIDEMFKVRLFLKEDKMSYTVVIKLPTFMDTDSLEFYKGGKLQKAVQLYASMYQNWDASKGNTYLCDYFTYPRDAQLSAILPSASGYIGGEKFITCILTKSLLGFKNCAWSLRPYLQNATKGVSNEYDSLKEYFSLGKGIGLGIYPGGIQNAYFTDMQSAGILQGGAGSGKTAMNDSILVQSLALDYEFGKGSVIMIDGKHEWIPAWENEFRKRGNPFFGFSGVSVNTSEALKEQEDKKQKKKVPVPMSKTMKDSFLGAIFIDYLVMFINKIRAEASKETSSIDGVKAFNKYCKQTGNSYYGFTELPKIMVIVDEVNVLRGEANKDPFYKGCFLEGFIRAKETRSQGFSWFLVGQNLKDSIIPSVEKPNYNFLICGSMSAKDYEYHGIAQNKAVQDYERRTKRAGGAPTIMSQGVFYAGTATTDKDKSKTSVDNMLVKCMYLPPEERGGALDDIGGKFEGQMLIEKLVLTGLELDWFDMECKLIGERSNLIYVILRNKGYITDEQLAHYTDRMFEDNGMSDADIDIKEEDSGKIDKDLFLEANGIGDSAIGCNSEFGGGAESPKVLKSQRGGEDIVKGALIGGAIGMGVGAMLDSNSTDENEEVGQSPYIEVDDAILSNRHSNNELDMSKPFGSTLGGQSEGDFNSVDNLYAEIPQDAPVRMEEMRNPNTFMGCECYNSELEVKVNPFSSRGSKTVFGGIDAFASMTKIVSKEIEKVYHGYNRVKSIHVSNNGLFINEIAFRPQIPKDVVESLPIDIKGEVSKGNIVEFFDFRLLFKCKNIEVLVVDSVSLAEGRMRQELRVDKGETWDVMYENFDYLSHFEIGGKRINTPEELEEYIKEGGAGHSHKLQSDLADIFKIDRDMINTIKSPVSKLWRSRPVKIVTGAVGITLGTQAVFAVAPIFGAWGALFGLATGVGVYNSYFKRKKH